MDAHNFEIGIDIQLRMHALDHTLSETRWSDAISCAPNQHVCIFRERLCIDADFQVVSVDA